MSKEVFDALGDVASYALSVDDSILGDYKYQTPAGLTHALTFERNGHQYDVRAPASKRYFAVDYLFRLSSRFEDHLQENPEDVDSILDTNEVNWGEDVELTQEDRVQAAAKIHISSISEENLGAVTDELTQRMTQVNCQHDWLWTGDDNQIWDGIRVTRRIYPFEDDFSVRDFDQAVIDTISVGYSASVTLSENLNLSIDIEEDDPTASARGFQ